MRLWLCSLVAATAALVQVLSGPQAEADMMGGSVAVGGKTQPDSEPFKRSEVIRNLVEVNPALAQIVIRRLVELSAQHGVALFSNDDGLGTGELNLEHLERASPTAVLDLIELMKQASKTR